MHHPNYSTLLFATLMLLIHPVIAHSAGVSEKDTGSFDLSPDRYSVDLLYPTKDDRDITTYNFNIYSHIDELSYDKLSVFAGLTATYAYGTLSQLEGDLSMGTLHEAEYDTNGAGIGPGILLNLELWDNNRFSVHLFGSGHLIFYDKDFPSGGDRYNFMWRGGPIILTSIDQALNIGIGYQWMHVSNGQGVGPKNPTYDAEGLTLHYSYAFK